MNITRSFVALFALLSISFLVGSNYAAPEPAKSPSSAAIEPASAHRVTKLVYKPPVGAGNIPMRVSGGARGGEIAGTSLLALVPDHVALTTQAQPSLFWFQSRPAKAKLELTLVEPRKAKPLLSLTSSQADKAGMHRVKLAKHNIELQPDVLYEWNVAIVPDAENRSKDIIAKGVIKRVKASADLGKSIENADDLGRAAAYAEAGIWYDALEAISDAIDAHPADASLHMQRASLLKQVGLPEAAAGDKR
jgi:hypothetical protein